MKITIPGLKLVSEANAPTATKRGRMAASNRTRQQRMAVGNALRVQNINGLSEALPKLPLIVTIIRVATRKLDTDNLARACKGVRDSVAEYYGVSDAPGGPITWRYWQRAGRPREYACELLIEERQQVALRRWDGVDVWRDIVRGGGLKAPELRAFIVQCEGALEKLMEAENT